MKSPARALILRHAQSLRDRAQLLASDDPLRTVLEREAEQAEARADTAGPWSPGRRRERRRVLSLALSTCPRGCSTRCAEGVCTYAHS